jgi:S1-C subfamily serine protease
MDEKRVIKTVKKVMPAVVSIVIAKRLEDLEREMPAGHYPFIPGHPNVKRERNEEMKMLGEMADEHRMVEVGGGSGCIVDPDGLVLTNRHVIDDVTAEYTVILNDGRRLPAKILSRDPINDIAILKIEAVDLPSLKLGDAGGLELGQSVVPRHVQKHRFPRHRIRPRARHHGTDRSYNASARNARPDPDRRGDQSRQFGRSAR